MFIHKAAASIQVCWHLQPDLASANHRPFCWHLLCLSQSQAVLYLVWFSACQWGSLFLYSLDSCWWTVSFTGDLICMQFWPQPITGRAVSCTIFRRPMRFSVSLQPGLVQMDGVLYRGLDLYVRHGQRFPRWPISNPPKRGVTFRKLFWNIQFTKSFMRRNSFWLSIFFNFTVIMKPCSISATLNTVEGGQWEKERQRSSVLFEEQHLFNFLPHLGRLERIGWITPG